MNLLFIMHALSWCDKHCLARKDIQRLIDEGGFDQCLELTPALADIRNTRYASHNGIVLMHEGVSPASFLREELFGASPLFPHAERVTLVGGVLNATGGGCLNCAFDQLVSFCHRKGNLCEITIPICATYQEWEKGAWEDERQVALVARDLLLKLQSAEAAFQLFIDGYVVAGAIVDDVMLRVYLDTMGLGFTEDGNNTLVWQAMME